MRDLYIKGNFNNDGNAMAIGEVANVTTGTKFGRNPDIDISSTPEDIWSGGGVYTGQPTSFTPETVDVFSSDAADSIEGTGARTIRIFGLKTSTSTDYESEDLSLNGTTAVTSTNTWWRVNRAIILTGGSTGENEGAITIRSSETSANVFTGIAVGLNQTTIAAYTVPYGKRILIKRIRVSIVRANGSLGSSTISLRARPTNGVFNAIRAFEVQTGAPTEFSSFGGDVIPAGTDIKFRVDSVSDNNTLAEAAIEYVLMDE